MNREFPAQQAADPHSNGGLSSRRRISRADDRPGNPGRFGQSRARGNAALAYLLYGAQLFHESRRKSAKTISASARTTDEQEKVTGSAVSGHKIGGDVDDAIVLFPDPMGATGGTLVEAIDLYKKRREKRANTSLFTASSPPNILRKSSRATLISIVYAIRLDRGLSPEEVLDTVPGTHWDRERGLNDKHYIVPGGGGFGEILNNAYV